MTTIYLIVSLYLITGSIFLALVYKFNSGVRKNIREAPYELFDKFTARGTFVSLRVVKAILYPAIWLGWIFIIVGMMQGKYKKTNSTKRSTVPSRPRIATQRTPPRPAHRQK